MWDLSEQLSQCHSSYGAAEKPPFEWSDSKGYSDYGSVTGGGHCSSKLAPLIDKKFALCTVGCWRIGSTYLKTFSVWSCVTLGEPFDTKRNIFSVETRV